MAASTGILLLLRILLPLAVLLASFSHFSLLSLFYFLSFLLIHARPCYTLRKGVPYYSLLFLFVYSVLNLLAQIALAILIATSTVNPERNSVLLNSIGICRFDLGAWQGIRTIIGPGSVLGTLLLIALSREERTNERYVIFWFLPSESDEEESASERGEEGKVEEGTFVQDADVASRTSNSDSATGHPVDTSGTPQSPSEIEVSRFTVFIAGRGGLFWSLLSMGLTAIAYSSLLTGLYLTCFAFCIIAWAFRWKCLRPAQSPKKMLRLVKLLRLYTFSYLLAMFIVQVEWLSSVRYSRYGPFVGLVPIDSEVPQGWSYIMAFSSAIFLYIISGMFAKGVNAAFLKFGAVLPVDPSTQRGSLGLSAREVVLFRATMHVSPIALLAWSLVFPGVTSLPIMIFAFLYFILPWWRKTRKVDYFIVYLVALQMVQFIYSAAADLAQLEDSSIIRLLGLRRFQPQFGMNVSQAIAVVLLSLTVYLKRYLPAHSAERTSASDESRRQGEQSDPALDNRLITRLLFRAEYSAVSRGAFSFMRVIIDQLALVSLYVSGGASAAVLNAIFLLTLSLLCLCQAFRHLRRRKIISAMWMAVLVYSAAFLMTTSSLCRAGSGIWSCNLEVIGVQAASTVQVISYACTVVLAAVQFHFTWPWCLDDEEKDRVREFRHPFWLFLRGYFILFAYSALLLYPLGSPANYLSYAYLVFLLFCILVEILLRGSSLSQINIHTRSRDIIGRVWFLIVIFACLAMLARYIVRFPLIDQADALTLWVFGLDRGASGFQLTLGDAVLLIMMSLQSRLFAIDRLVANSSYGEIDSEHDEDRTLNSVRNVNDRTPARQKSGFLTAAVAAFSTHAAATEEEQFAEAARLIRRLRNSMQVIETYRILRKLFVQFQDSLKRLLFRFSYVFEALAILAAAVWLGGFSVFGAVYLALGCILVFSDQRPLVRRGEDRVTPWGMRMLPPILAVLSFSLMSVQYLYIILSASGRSWGSLAAYLGLQATRQDPETRQLAIGLLPLSQEAMLAHVLVFVMAFLQQGTKRWANAEIRKMIAENGKEEIVRAAENPQSSADALASAVSVSEALPGVKSLNVPDNERKLVLDRGEAVKTVFGGRAELSGKAVAFRVDSEESIRPVRHRRIRSESCVDSSAEMKRGTRQVDKEVDTYCSDGEITSQSPGSRLSPISESYSAHRPPDWRRTGLRRTYDAVREVTGSLGISSRRVDQIISGERTQKLAKGASHSLDKSEDASSEIKTTSTWSRLRVLIRHGFTHISEIWSLLTPFWRQWGFDITYMYLVIGGTITRTVFSVVYIFFVLSFCAIPRKKVAHHWTQATLILITLVAVQYLLTLGLPSFVGPQERWVDISAAWAEWLYLDRFNGSAERKADVTVGFLAVICAGVTLDAVTKGQDEDCSQRNSSVESLAENTQVAELLSVRSEAQDDSQVAFGHAGPDFTRRPLSYKYWVKLCWMRSSGSLVQLFMFTVAVVNTNVFSAILLLVSFYFFTAFSNVATKKARFNLVRFYVLGVLLSLVIFQAPFLTRPEGHKWANIVGFYKVTSRNGRVLIYMMVALWVLSQVQGRVYESANFRYVLKDIKRNEAVRFRRALHEHHGRKYEKMLDYNKLFRSRRKRADRLERLKVLKTRQRGVDALYEVCVVQEIEYLKRHKDEFDEKLGEERVLRERAKEKTGVAAKFARFLLRGKRWFLFADVPLVSEVQGFVKRHSAWPVYTFMILAVIQAPSIFTLAYPVVLFLYLIPEQPRPPKLAWTLLIFYVYLVILFKYIARKPELVPQCNSPVSSFGVKSGGEPDILDLSICTLAAGIFYDILVLLSLMWHRMFLYYRGLWDLRDNEEDLRLRNRIKGRRYQRPVELSRYSFWKGRSSESSTKLETETTEHDPHGQAAGEAWPQSTGCSNFPQLGTIVSVDQQLSEADEIRIRFEEDVRHVSSQNEGNVQDTALKTEEPGTTGVDYEPGDSASSLDETEANAGLPSNLTARTEADRTVNPVDGERSQMLRNDSISESQDLSLPVGLRRRRPLTIDPMSRLQSFSELDSNLQDITVPPVGESYSVDWFPRATPVGDRPRTWTSPLGELDITRSNQEDRSHSRLRRIRTRLRGRNSHVRSTGDDQMLVHSKTLRTLAEENVIDTRRPKRSRSVESSSDEEAARSEGSDSGENAKKRAQRETRQEPGDQNSGGKALPVSKGKESAKRRDRKKGSSRTDPIYVLRASERVGLFSPIASHFRRLLRSHQHKAVGDYYLLTFSMDFICFVYMIFGFSSMFSTRLTENEADNWWSTNFISTAQLLTLLAMFTSIVLDRVIYLKRSMIGKLVLQYASVVLYHYAIFFRTSISSRISVKIFYIFRCIYFLLSGLQIRLGFPQYTTGQYLLRNYSTPGVVLFEIYYYIPFLWLMRTLLDWAVLPTSLEIFQYLRFVDIYLWLYRNRAINSGRGKFRRTLGEKRRLLPRVYQGYGLFLLCVFLLFLPFFLFSFFNPFFSRRVLTRSTLTINLSPSSSLSYNLFMRSSNITDALSDVELGNFGMRYKIEPQLREREQIYLAEFAPISETTWNPTPPDLAALIASLGESEGMMLPELSFTLSSQTNSESFRASSSVRITQDDKEVLLNGLQNRQQTNLYLPVSLRRYWLLTSGSRVFQSALRGNEGVCLGLHFDDSVLFGGNNSVAFWSISDCVLACEGCENISSFDSVEKVGYLLQVADVSSISLGGGTILTVFSAILFTIASLARSWFSNKRQLVPYVDMPYTLHLYQLVNDILYARQDNDLEMEEILYNGLTDIYRDPSTLVKWTGERALKPKDPWWEGENGLNEYPSFKETDTEPYTARYVD